MKLRHPAFPEITRQERAYAAWRDAGWVVVKTPAKGAPDAENSPGDPAEA